MNREEQKCLVLVVDDDFNFADAVEVALIYHGFTPYVAHVGNAGIQKFNMYRPDVVVLDLHMPKVGGLKVLKDIKEADADAMVVGLGANEHDKNEARKLGADVCINKPITPQAICEIVMGLVGTTITANVAAVGA